MKGREGNKGAPPTDLLVCFPSRSHLSLMPKQICSPVRPNDASKRHLHQHQKVQNHHHHHLHNQKGGGQGSPLLWAKTTKAMGSEIDEPTSPKVTCAGQIKVRPKPSSCKNWQSVMEEIERLHKHNNTTRNNKHKNKKASWGEALGFKKDVMQFMTCLRGLRFDLRCFGSFQGSDVISDDDDEDEGEEGEGGEGEEEEEEESEVGVETSSRTVFSKWYMVLQENQNNNGLNKDQHVCEEEGQGEEEEEDGCGSHFPSAPPPNALLLMRCRSAPAKSWLEEKEEEEEEEKKQQQKEEEEEEEEMKTKVMLMEEEKRKENLILRCYSPDFFKVSSDVAKETWVVGGVRDQLSRSRSWKR